MNQYQSKTVIDLLAWPTIWLFMFINWYLLPSGPTHGMDWYDAMHKPDANAALFFLATNVALALMLRTHSTETSELVSTAEHDYWYSWHRATVAYAFSLFMLPVLVLGTTLTGWWIPVMCGSLFMVSFRFFDGVSVMLGKLLHTFHAAH